MRVIGIDIGIRNLVLCSLDVVAGSKTLRGAQDAIESARRIEWTFGELCDPKQNANKCSHTFLLDRMILFVRTHRELLCEWADTIVIEAQPAARMKMLAGALYVLIRNESTRPGIIMQPAKKKLAWPRDELMTNVPQACKQTTYTDRKKAAVKLCDFLLVGGNEETQRARSVFQGTRKKDDAADSLLHALHFVVYGVVSGERFRSHNAANVVDAP